MSGMAAAIQAVLLQAQALNTIADNIPATLPIPVPAFEVASAGSVALDNVLPTTTVTDAACTTLSKIFLTPTDGSAAASVVYVDIIANGSFTIENPAVAVGCTLFYLIVN